MNSTITIDNEDVVFIYGQLRLRREYLISEMERQTKLGDSFEVDICQSGIKRINKVLESMIIV